MRQTLGFAAALLVLVTVAGCGGGIVKGYTAREARARHAAAATDCPAKLVKTEVVKEMPPPEGKDYVAIIKATGCGSSKNYLCWSNTGLASYECEDAK